MNFESFHFHPHIESGIKALGFTVPTSIQLQSIPKILQQKDVMGLAQTGTGKTAAFVLPILQRLTTGVRKRVRALIIAPTRELAEQINKDINDLGRYTKIRSVTIYGGVSKYSQVKELHRGPEIAVACPGRLIDLMDQGEIDLSGVEVLVLDEADRMFDMGFLPDIRKILRRIPRDRQTLLFSATMPDDVRHLARETLRDPHTVKIGETGPVSTVSHAIYPVEHHLKTALLMKLLTRTETESVLVFTRTKHRATRVASQMKKAGFLVTSLQGDMSQQNREKAINGFRNGRYRILVATDIAARGIDVSRISHVINYDMPDTVDAYTHRIGRTGRADKTGDAFSFATRDDRATVWDIEKVLGQNLEHRILKEFDYSAPPPVREPRSGGSRNGSGGRPPLNSRQPSLRRSGVSAVEEVSVSSKSGPSDFFRGTLPFSSPRPKSRRKLSMG